MESTEQAAYEHHPRHDILPLRALDERIAVVGTSGSGKTYAMKVFVERLLGTSARVCVVDPMGGWWGLRTMFNPAVVGGEHGDIPLTEAMGAPLAEVVGNSDGSFVIDLTGLKSQASRRRFMTAFSEKLYEENREPLHLVLDEADLWAPQKPMPDQTMLFHRIDEIVRRGRVRGFIPWLITQRPAVLSKDVLSQADILVAMKLTSSQDRAALGAWLDGQADRETGKRILAELPKLQRGQGYVWAPGDEILERVHFPKIASFDSSATPTRGERHARPQLRAMANLAGLRDYLDETIKEHENNDPAALRARIEALEAQLVEARAGGINPAAIQKAREDGMVDGMNYLRPQIARIREEFERLASMAMPDALDLDEPEPVPPAPKRYVTPTAAVRVVARAPVPKVDGLNTLATLLLVTARGVHPVRMSWRQLAMTACRKGHGPQFIVARKQLLNGFYVREAGDTVELTERGIAHFNGQDIVIPGGVTLERIQGALPDLAAKIFGFLRHNPGAWDPDQIAASIDRKPSGPQWNAAWKLLNDNDLVALSGDRKWSLQERLR